MMIRSMTGYGRCETEKSGHKMHLEMSSVNHRYCDLNMRLPRTLSPLEEKIRKHIKQVIGRGKVEVNLHYMSLNEEDVEVVVNEAVCMAYVHTLRELGEKLELKDNLGLAELMSGSDLVSIHKKTLDLEKVWEMLEDVLNQALAELLRMREIEGQALKEDLQQKAYAIEDVINVLLEVSPKVVENYKLRLEERLDKLKVQGLLDESRLATEVALFADKCAIDEELTRLRSHVAQLLSILEEGGQVGRKLDFLMQEMNREANTIASKANNYTVTNYAVELKTEIEKMREQIQNIE